MTRSVEEWVGATPDVAIPKRVKLRVFERHNGICHISGRKITAADQWDCDHIVALCNGGGHRESNLAPALRDKHRAKTADDVAAKSKTARVRAKHLGIKRSARPMPGSRASKFKRHMDGRVTIRETRS